MYQQSGRMFSWIKQEAEEPSAGGAFKVFIKGEPSSSHDGSDQTDQWRGEPCTIELGGVPVQIVHELRTVVWWFEEHTESCRVVCNISVKVEPDEEHLNTEEYITGDKRNPTKNSEIDAKNVMIDDSSVRNCSARKRRRIPVVKEEFHPASKMRGLTKEADGTVLPNTGPSTPLCSNPTPEPNQCELPDQKSGGGSTTLVEISRVSGEQSEKQNTESATSEQYPCDRCGEHFLERPQLERHQRAHSNRAHTSDAPFQCQYCSKTFRNSSGMVRHERVHTGARPYDCGYCEKKFTNPTSLKAHETLHTGKKRYQCSYCEKSFFCRTRFTYHERRHTGDRPLLCHTCGDSFFSPASLSVHEQTHTGKRHQCSYCTKSFTTKGQVKIHEREHTGDALHRCQFCDKTFARRGYLVRHEMGHTGQRPFQCDQCDKTYTDRKYLKDHQISHSEVKPFKCSMCEKAFHRKEHLRTHELAHGGKVFKCDYCDKAYTTMTWKKNHEKVHKAEPV